MDSELPQVLLLDEIDKAQRDFPNDLPGSTTSWSGWPSSRTGTVRPEADPVRSHHRRRYQPASRVAPTDVIASTYYIIFDLL